MRTTWCCINPQLRSGINTKVERRGSTFNYNVSYKVRTVVKGTNLYFTAELVISVRQITDLH